MCNINENEILMFGGTNGIELFNDIYIFSIDFMNDKIRSQKLNPNKEKNSNKIIPSPRCAMIMECFTIDDLTKIIPKNNDNINNSNNILQKKQKIITNEYILANQKYNENKTNVNMTHAIIHGGITKYDMSQNDNTNSHCIDSQFYIFDILKQEWIALQSQNGF